MSEQSRDRYDYLPIAIARVPPPGKIHHFKDYWWAVDPERGLLFYQRRNGDRLFWSPQGNSDERITRRLKPDWAEAQLIPSVFVQIDYYGEYLLPRSVLL